MYSIQPSTASVAAAAENSIDIDWGSLALVFVVAFIATVLLVAVYSTGLRLLSAGDPEAGTPRPVPATVAAWVLIGLCAAGVLYGVYLLFPQFH